jgi:hypothetical protein
VQSFVLYLAHSNLLFQAIYQQETAYSPHNGI